MIYTFFFFFLFPFFFFFFFFTEQSIIGAHTHTHTHTLRLMSRVEVSSISDKELRVIKAVVWVSNGSNSIREIMLVRRKSGCPGLSRPTDRSYVSLNSRSCWCSRNAVAVSFCRATFSSLSQACVPVSFRIGAHRAISISTVEHLLAKLRPRKRNGNNVSRVAQWAQRFTV